LEEIKIIRSYKMITTSETKIEGQYFISDHAVLIKKMRLLKRLTRQQAAELYFDFSFKTIEKLENGRGPITIEKFREFQEKYGFSDNDVEAIRTGKIQVSSDANSIRKKITTEKRKDRRFCHRQVTRECKVLKEMRIQKGLDQYSASELCRFGVNTVGFIENGRVALTDRKLNHIVETYGFTMEYFFQLLKLPLLRHEMVEDGQSILGNMDDNKLRVVLPMLQSMAKN
jgi:transcriptional regulator with XRE-family HTH domain